MYLDLSIRKIIPLLLITAFLASSVALTFEAKNSQYGSTPFYAAVGLGTQQALGYPTYAIEVSAGKLFDRIRAFFGFGEEHLLNSQSAPGEAHGIPVLEYHRLVQTPDGSNITEAHFKDQMKALAENGWHTITLADFEAFMRGEKSLPAKSVLLTFDDGTKQSYYAVDPILRAHGFNAVNYIISNANITADQEGSTYYLSTEEIKNMLQTGRWEIGSHSYDGHHPYPVDAHGSPGNFFADRLWREDLGRLETENEFAERVHQDLVRARETLEARFGVTIDTFAYPFGETGIETANNFPGGLEITDREAARIYSYGWLQTHRGEYSYNYPQSSTFIIKRVQVNPSWSGNDLVAALSRGMGKELPYEDDMTLDRGWLPSWNTYEMNNGLLLRASATSSGASVLLDGSRAWKDYETRASVSWSDGFAMVLGAVAGDSTYRACVFSPEHVRLQRVVEDDRSVILDRNDASIQRGEVVLGMRIQGSITECLFNNRVVLYAQNLPRTQGGIGFQVWDERLGAASMRVHNLSVRDVRADALPRNPLRTVNIVERADTNTAGLAIPNTGYGGYETQPQSSLSNQYQQNLNPVPAAFESPPTPSEVNQGTPSPIVEIVNRIKENMNASTTAPQKASKQYGRHRGHDRN
ncbi:polysaccharide deacetylase family protein [Candidatus Kaiserbacteria bacterium]|nr:polysaccharide deacetylase family protein [Candidatus Kaiserbacteria bacterium]